MDEKWMLAAIEQAKIAASLGEVPVGAVVVRSGTIIGAGHNRRESEKNALCHAELIAINQACEYCRGWRLEDCILYVTLEPCPMCAGAAINARLKKVVYGAPEPKAGSCHSVVRLFDLPYNHQPECVGGILEKQCAALLSDFFHTRRQHRKTAAKGIIFDLDGTLWDSTMQVISAWNSVLKDYRHALTPPQMYLLMNKTLTQTAAFLLPELPQEQALSILNQCYLAEIRTLQKQGGQLYPHIEEVLRRLQTKYPLYIVSHCRPNYLDAFFTAHQTMQQYFSDTETTGRTGRSLSENIRLLMKRNHLRQAVYIGSTENDRIAAQTAGISFLYTSYGSGKPRSYDFKADSPKEILTALEK